MPQQRLGFSLSLFGPSASWESSPQLAAGGSVAIEAMTYSDVSRCSNGKQGSLISWQPAVHSFSPSIHLFDCSDPVARETSGLIILGARLHHRQPAFTCQAPCSTECSTSGSQYNADECGDLSNWMWQRNAQYPVDSQQRVVLTWGSCMYAFTNDMQSNVTWCDAEWAQIGKDIARPCLTQSSAGGTCRGRGFLVEVLSNDGSTNTPTAYTTPTSSGTSISSTISSSTHTEVPIPLITIASPTSTPASDSQYGTTTVAVVPVVLGVVGGVAFLMFLLICVCMTWRRASRGNTPVVSKNTPITSEEVHEIGPRPRESSYSNVSKLDFSSVRLSQQPTLPRPASQNSVSRGSSRLSYTLDFDPFRSLRRALSGRARKQPTPGAAL